MIAKVRDLMDVDARPAIEVARWMRLERYTLRCSILVARQELMDTCMALDSMKNLCQNVRYESALAAR